MALRSKICRTIDPVGWRPGRLPRHRGLHSREGSMPEMRSWTAARTWTLAFPQRTESSRRAIVHLHEGQLSYGEGPERRVDNFGRVDVRLEFSVRAPRRTEVIPHAGVLHTDDARHDMARE